MVPFFPFVRLRCVIYNVSTMNNNILNKKRSPLKERQLRYPGQSLDSEINDLRFEINILVGFVCGFIALALYE